MHWLDIRDGRCVSCRTEIKTARVAKPKRLHISERYTRAIKAGCTLGWFTDEDLLKLMAVCNVIVERAKRG